MEEGPDIITADESNFDLQVLEYSQRLPVLVDFWAKWCRDCQRTSQQLEELAANLGGRFRLAQVNVDHNPNLTQDYQVRTLPTLKAFQNGSVTAQMEGPRTNLQLEEFVRQVAPGPERLLLEKAASHLAEGQFRAAEEVCLEVLEELPGSPPARLLLAKSLIWQGEYLEALAVLNRFPASREFQGAEKLIPLAEALLAVGEGGEPGGTLEAVYRRALRLIRDGNLPAGMEGLIELVRRDKKFRGGAPREIILGIFELLGEGHPLVEEYRQLLASALF